MVHPSGNALYLKATVHPFAILTNLKTLLVAVCALEYGEAVVAALLRLLGFNLPILRMRFRKKTRA